MTRPRCMALNAAGDQCRNRAKHDADYCGAHSGSIGRPTKLTRPLADAIAERVQHGAFYEEAAVAAGVHKATLYRWLETGEADLEHGRNTPAAYFRDALTRASAAAEEEAALAILRHRFDDWRAAAWYLERRNPARWGKTDRVDVNVGARPADVELVAPSSDEAALEVARILERAGAVTRDDEAA